MIVTPLSVTSFSSAWVRLQLPPRSAARSTTTEPGFMAATMSAVHSSGAGRFGISAVVITMSTSGASSRNFSSCFSRNSGLDGAAYPPVSAPSVCSSSKSRKTNSAPMDSICSDTSGRTSKAMVMAPSDTDVPIAARPATPAPTTSTLAGGTLPAAVICPMKKRPKLLPASTTAR